LCNFWWAIFKRNLWASDSIETIECGCFSYGAPDAKRSGDCEMARKPRKSMSNRIPARGADRDFHAPSDEAGRRQKKKNK
jgi:hypothetical protein